MAFVIVPFAGDRHVREGFDCEVPAFNLYLERQSGQDMRRHYATMFVAVQELTNQIIGFYTLSSASVSLALLPDSLQKKLPKYTDVPAVRLGRLAVDKSAQGRGIGKELLADAVIRSLQSVVAWAALVVDAKDEKACAFYRRFGFVDLLDDPKHLYSFRQDLEKRFFETQISEIRDFLKRNGSLIGNMDMLIAASAVSIAARIVTNNKKYFSQVPDLTIADWI